MLKETIAAGLALQEVDRAIRSLVVEREKKPLDLAKFRERKEALTKELEEIKNKLKTLKVEIHQAETGVKAVDEKVERLNIQSNTVKKNEEYQAIMKEIRALKAEKGMMEDKLLEYYDRVEKTDGEVKEKEKECHAMEKEIEAKNKEIEAAMAAINDGIRAQEPKRREIAEKLNGDFMRSYERIMAVKEDGVVLSEAARAGADAESASSNDADFFCQTCMSELTSQEINLLKLNKDIVTCRNCSRILYLSAHL